MGITMILAIVQARFSSTRLPGKVLLPLLDEPMLIKQLERIQRAKNINQIVVATSVDQTDDAIENICLAHHKRCFRGSLMDVLDRYYQAAKFYQPQHIVRLTGDCPLIDADIIDQVIALHLQQQNDYTSNVTPPSFPDGLDVEVMTFATLTKMWQRAILPSEREHVTLHIHHQPELYQMGNLSCPMNYESWRLTVDTEQDYNVVKNIYAALYSKNPRFTFNDIIHYIDRYPEVLQLNNRQSRNQGMKASLLLDEEFLRDYHYDK